MTKACFKCRYCRMRVSVWIAALAIVASITAVASGMVPLSS